MMENPLSEQLTDLHSQTLNTAQKFAELNSSVWMNLSQKQMDVLSLYMDGGIKQLQVFTENDSVEAMLKAHNELLQTFQKDLLGTLQETAELLLDAEQQWLALCESSVRDMSAAMPNASDVASLSPVKVMTEVAETVKATAEEIVEQASQPVAKKTVKKTTRKTPKSAKTTKAEETAPVVAASSTDTK